MFAVKGCGWELIRLACKRGIYRVGSATVDKELMCLYEWTSSPQSLMLQGIYSEELEMDIEK